MSDFSASIRLSADDQISPVIDTIDGKIGGLLGSLASLAAAATAGLGFTEAVRSGIEFNRVMEDSQAGIAALILSSHNFTTATGQAAGAQQALAASFQVSGAIQEDFLQIAMKTAASYTDLVSAFQTAYGPAMAAGVTNIEKLKTVTVSASQAVAALGLDSRQLTQEIRAIFTGEQGPDNTLNRVLGITKAQLDEVRKSGGDVGDYLIQKLKPFADAAAASMGNFSIVLSNTKDALQQALGQASVPLFQALKRGMAEASDEMGTFQISLNAIGRDLGAAFSDSLPALRELGRLVVETTASLVSMGRSVAELTPLLVPLGKVAEVVVGGFGDIAIAGYAAYKGVTVLISGLQAMGALTAVTWLVGEFQALTLSIGILTGAAPAATLAMATLATAGIGVVVAAVIAALGYIVILRNELKENERLADEAVAGNLKAINDRLTALQARVTSKVHMEWITDLKTEIAKGTISADDATKSFMGLTASLKGLQAQGANVLLDPKKIADPEAAKKAAAELEKLRKEAEKIRAEVINEWGRVGKSGMELVIEKIEEKWNEKIPKLAAQYGWLSDEVEMATLERDQEVQRAEEAGWNKLLEKAKHGSKQYVDVVETNLLPGLITVFAKLDNVSPIPPEWQVHAATALQGILTKLEDYGERVKSYTTTLWGNVASLFDTVFFSAMTLDLKGIEDAFKTFGTNILKLLSQVFSDIVQKWLLTQLAIKQNPLTGEFEFGANGGGYAGGGSSLGGLVGGAAIGAGVGSMIGGGQTGNIVGGAVGGLAGGALAGTELGVTLLSWAGPVGWIVGAIVGAIIGAIVGGLFNKNTEQSISGGIYDAGLKFFNSMSNRAYDMGAFLKKNGYDVDPGGLQADYQARIKAMTDGAYWKVSSGDGTYNQQGAEDVMTKLIPKLGIMAMFGRQGYGLPNGNRDNAGGWGGLDWWAPGMDGDGNWIEKKLYDKDAPIPKMLTALGFTGKRIEEIAGMCDTTAPDELLKWLQNLLEVVVGFDKLSKAFGGASGKGQTGADLWAEATKRNNVTALDGFKDTAANILDLAAQLPNYVGDEQVAKAKELVQLGNQYYESQVQYVQQLIALSDKLKSGIKDQIEGMKVDMMSDPSKLNYFKAQMEAAYAELAKATTPDDVARITAKIQGYGSQIWGMVKGTDQAASWEAWIENLLNKTAGLADAKLKAMADAVAETSKGLQEAMEKAKLLFTDVNGALPTTAANTKTLGDESAKAATSVSGMAAKAKEAADALTALATAARMGGGGSGGTTTSADARQQAVNDVLTVIRRNPGILGRQFA